MYYLYVIKNQKGIFYKGITQNIEHRLYQHNNMGSRWTHNKGPWKLVYKEEYSSRSEAVMREKYFKSGQGREMLKVILITGCGAVG